MVKDIALDFGTLIAYLIPGYVALRALAGLGVAANELLPEGATFDGQGVVVITVGSLVAGMLVSIVRAVVLERTFALGFQTTSKLPPHWRRIRPATLDYARLADEGRMAAYQEAKASEKRPFQFYGNTFLAITLLLVARLATGATPITDPSTFVLLVAMAFLYVGARSAYYRYVEALRSL